MKGSGGGLLLELFVDKNKSVVISSELGSIADPVPMDIKITIKVKNSNNIPFLCIFNPPNQNII